MTPTSSVTLETLVRNQRQMLSNQEQTIRNQEETISINRVQLGENDRAITLMQQTIQAREAELTRTLGHIQGVRQIHLNELANLQAQHDSDIFWGGVKGITAASLVLFAAVSSGGLTIGAGFAGFAWGGGTGMAGMVLGGVRANDKNIKQQRRAATLANQLILPPAQ